MAVDGGGGGVHPEARRVDEGGEGLMKEQRWADAGIIKLAAIARCLAAVDTAAGEMDADVGALESLDPGTELNGVPMHRLPWRRVRTAREDGDVMAAVLKKLRQHAADLAAAAGNDDAQFSHRLTPIF